MKKYFLFFLLVLFSFTLISCQTNGENGNNSNNPEVIFNKMKSLSNENNSFYSKSNNRNVYPDGSTYSWSVESFVQGDIEYAIFDDGTKIYYDWSVKGKKIRYEYYSSDGKWHRSVDDIGTSFGSIDFWDYNNYDYIDGSFVLKKHILENDQISFKRIYISDTSYRILDEYTFRVDGISIRRVEDDVRSRFGENFNLSLPKNYVND